MTRPIQHKTELRFGDFEADLRSGELRRNGHRLRLREKSLQLLAILIERPGRVVSKEELQRRLWPDVQVDADAGLGEAVYKLRQALGDSARTPRYIETLPKRGYRFIAKIELGEELEAKVVPDSPHAPNRASRLTKGMLVLTGAIVGGIGVFIFLRSTPRESAGLPQRRFAYEVEKLSIDARTQPIVAISPDGKKLVFGAKRALWLQELDQLWNPRKLPGTESGGLVLPTWSPNSRQLAFSKGREIFILDLDVPAGSPNPLAKIPREAGALGCFLWTMDGRTVLFARGTETLEILAAGGKLATSEGFSGMPEFGSFVPSRNGFRLVGEGGSRYRPQIVVWGGPDAQSQDLTTGRLPRYSPTGHLVYQSFRDPLGIWAMPFSSEDAQATGSAFPVAPRGKSPSVSADGTLVYAEIPDDYDRLLLLDRRGQSIGHIGEPQAYIGYPSLSPDGKRVAVWGFEVPTETDWMMDIWIHEVDRPIKTRLTLHPKTDIQPRWTPDGKNVSFSSDRISGKRDLFLKGTDSEHDAEPLLISGDGGYYIKDWSQDGRLALIRRQASGQSDVWILDRQTGKAQPLLKNGFEEVAEAFSPDGRYVVFTSDRSGRNEVWVCEVADCEGNIRRVSTNGGYQSRWAKDQGSIYYVEDHSKMMEVRASTYPTLGLGEPVALFESPYLWLPGSERTSFYDVSADGEQFVVVEPARARTTKESPGVIHVWQNWAAAFPSSDNET